MKKYVAVVLTVFFLVGFTMGSIPISSASTTLTYFTILHTNDEHSALLPSPLSEYSTEHEDLSSGGFARLAGAVNAIRTEKAKSNEPVLLVSAGDYLGGSPFAWLALEGHAAELNLMQKLGYDVAVIGNHEYDFGPDLLAEYLRAAGYPTAHNKLAILASNTSPPTEHLLQQAGLKTTHIKELPNGLKIGFFSVIGEDAVKKAPLAKPLHFSNAVQVAKESVNTLRAQGADVVVAVNHAGLDEDKALAKNVPGINIIISGHCHTALQQPIIESGTIIVQTGNSLEYLGVLELSFDTNSKVLAVHNKGSLIRLDDKIPTDLTFALEVNLLTERLNAVVNRMTNRQFSDVRQTIIKSDFAVPNKPEFTETPFANFVTDAMRIVGSSATGDKVDFAIQADGVLRGTITPASSAHAKGNVAFLDLLDLVGLGSGPDKRPGYPLVSVYLTGEEIRRVLEVGVLLSELMGEDYHLQFSGLRMTYDPGRAVIARIPFKGTPIPSTRAVLSAQRYVGTGVQDQSSFEPLNRGDQTLYHVVSDYYIAQFLPMVGDMLPSLGLVLKDKHGNPIDNIDDAIVYRSGQELKVWQTVVEYAAAQTPDSDGVPIMPTYYASTSQRLTIKKTVPLIIYPAALLAAIIASGVLVVRRRRIKRLAHKR